MMLSRVDFPAPDGPVTATDSPLSTTKLTSARAFTAGSVPYFRDTCRSSITFGAGAFSSTTSV